jgi:hypothetical protein
VNRAGRLGDQVGTLDDIVFTVTNIGSDGRVS